MKLGTKNRQSSGFLDQIPIAVNYLFSAGALIERLYLLYQKMLGVLAGVI